MLGEYFEFGVIMCVYSDLFCGIYIYRFFLYEGGCVLGIREFDYLIGLIILMV